MLYKIGLRWIASFVQHKLTENISPPETLPAIIISDDFKNFSMVIS